MISYISVLTERSWVLRNAKKCQYSWRLSFGFRDMRSLSRHLQNIQNILTCSEVDLYIYQHVQECKWWFDVNKSCV